ncbi:MAG: hypothetical protein NTY47_01940, partial [Candidatus Omnitrophica bacterium]|nr:hypothetical protein [Candidatus Omnitrophota bacterium]
MFWGKTGVSSTSNGSAVFDSSDLLETGSDDVRNKLGFFLDNCLPHKYIGPRSMRRISESLKRVFEEVLFRQEEAAARKKFLQENAEDKVRAVLTAIQSDPKLPGQAIALVTARRDDIKAEGLEALISQDKILSFITFGEFFIRDFLYGEYKQMADVSFKRLINNTCCAYSVLLEYAYDREYGKQKPRYIAVSEIPESELMIFPRLENWAEVFHLCVEEGAYPQLLETLHRGGHTFYMDMTKSIGLDLQPGSVVDGSIGDGLFGMFYMLKGALDDLDFARDKDRNNLPVEEQRQADRNSAVLINDYQRAYIKKILPDALIEFIRDIDQAVASQLPRIRNTIEIRAGPFNYIDGSFLQEILYLDEKLFQENNHRELLLTLLHEAKVMSGSNNDAENEAFAQSILELQSKLVIPAPSDEDRALARSLASQALSSIKQSAKLNPLVGPCIESLANSLKETFALILAHDPQNPDYFASAQRYISTAPFGQVLEKLPGLNYRTIFTEATDLYQRCFDSWNSVAALTETNAINPGIRFKVTNDDPAPTVPSRTAKVVFYATKFEPTQLVHLLVIPYILAEFKAAKVVIMNDNSDPKRKPDLLTLVVREPVAQEILKSFGPFVQYITFQKENFELFAADGETVLREFMRQNREMPMD